MTIAHEQAVQGPRFPLTEIQHAYWLGRDPSFEHGGVATHAYFELDDKRLDPDRLQRSWNELVARHQMLRSIVLPSGEQAVLDEVPPYEIQVVDLRDNDEGGRLASLAEQRGRLEARPCHAERWPAFELVLSRLPDADRLHVSLDLLAVDLASIALVFAEWADRYSGATAGPPPLEVTFRDYVLAVEARRRSDRAARARSYWRERAAELPPGPALPHTNVRRTAPPRFSNRSARLSRPAWDSFQSIARTRWITPTAALATAFSEVLGRWSTNDRFTLNVTLFNRLPLLHETDEDGRCRVHPHLAGLVGDFTSVALLEPPPQVEVSFSDRARISQQQLGEDLAHRDASSLHALREQRRLRGGEQVLAPVVFTSALGLGARAEVSRAFDVFGDIGYHLSQTPQVWLDHQAFDFTGDLELSWDVVDDLFPPGVIDDMFSAYERLVNRLAADESAWDRVVVLDPVALSPARRAANQTAWTIAEGTLHEPVRARALEDPTAFAVASDTTVIDRTSLLRDATDIAATVQPWVTPDNRLIGVMMARSPAQIAAVLGVLEAGAAYLPVDPNLPARRRRQILEDGGVAAVVCDDGPADDAGIPEGVARLVVGEPTRDRDAETNRSGEMPGQQSYRARPEDLAYVIYTSGSTGAPKGVMIEHRAAANTIDDLNDRFAVGASDRVLAVSQLTFDLSVYDVFGMLGAGAGIVLPDADPTPDPSSWLMHMRRHQVTIWNSVPALMEMLVDHLEVTGGPVPPLRLIMLSGDWIPVGLPARIERLFPDASVVSLGGATECSIWSIAYDIDHVDPAWRSIPYGTPLRNQSWHVLDPLLQHRPDGVAGELHIAGAGLARGYWGDDERSAHSFLHHRELGRLYRTGDFGRYDADGIIEFLGRRDCQVKLRGHRVELGEIDVVTASHPDVHRCVTVVDPDTGSTLTSFVTLRDDAPDLCPPAAHQPHRDLAWRAASTSALAAAPTPSLASTWAALDDLYRWAAAKALTTLDHPQAGDPGRPGANAVPSVAPRYERWLARARAEVAARPTDTGDGTGDDVVPAAQPPVELTERLRRGLADTYGLEGADLDWLLEVAGSVAPILTEDVHSATLYASPRTPVVYQQLFATPYACARAATASFVERWPSDEPLRVLEVGAGLGSLTEHLLPLLPGHAEYLFTDISSFFLHAASDRFAHHPGFGTDLLDLDRDPALQGFADHRCDLVIAASVLHDTRVLAETLPRLRRLLAPGGALLLVEQTQFHPWFDLTMGLQQGFDAFADDELRTLNPLVDRPRWLDLLNEAGFDEARVLTDALGDAELTGFDVLVARRPPTDATFAPERLRAHVADRLPVHMTPGRHSALEAWPLTPTGKVDRSRLELAASGSHAGRASEAVTPRTTLEHQLLAIWSDVLDMTELGVTDDFVAFGGDSLLATRLAAQIRAELGVSVPLRTVLEAPTVRELAREIAHLPARPLEDHVDLVPDGDHRYDPFPLTDVQHAYWVGRQLSGISTHVYVEVDVTDLDLARIETALNQLIGRHDMLRAVVTRDGQQRVQREVPHYTIEGHACRGAGDEQRAELREALSHQVLAADRWPLFSICASRDDADRTLLHVSIDALMVDAWSMQLLVRELATLYADPTATLPPIDLCFRDYVLADHARRGGATHERASAYWQARIDTLPPGPALPLRQNPDELDVIRFQRRSDQLDPACWDALRNEARRAGLTPSAVLMAAYSEVLSRWSGAEPFTLNVTLFNRTPLHPDVDRLVGDFTSLNLLEVDGAETTFVDRARALQGRLWDDLEHRQHGGVQVMRDLARLGGQLSGVTRPVVFTSALALDSLGQEQVSFGDPVFGVSQSSHVWLDHQVYEDDGHLVLNWDAIDDLFPGPVLDDMFDAYRALLRDLAADPTFWQRDEVVALPSTTEVRASRQDDTTWPLTDGVLHDFIVDQPVDWRDRVAVIGADGDLTHGELADRARRLASVLRNAGAGPGSLVAVALDRSWRQVVATLGVLSCGAAYVPISTDWPVARRRQVIAGSGSTVVVVSCTDTAWADPGVAVVEVDGDDVAAATPLTDVATSPDDRAYVIYTSGSTGQPKGVEVTHRAALNTVLDINDRFRVSAVDRVLALSELTFDLSVYDIFGVLRTGGAMVVPSADRRLDPAHWVELLDHHGVTLWNSVPALCGLLVGQPTHNLERAASDLRLVMLSGDWIPLELPARIRSVAPGARVVGLGGATEAAIWSVAHEIDDIDPEWTTIPYGDPLRNQRVVVLDHRQRTCPDWVTGELHIVGV